VRSDDSNERPPPSEGEFKDFATRLLHVPKAEIDRLEADRKLHLRRHGQPHANVERESDRGG
jgi:hypothetical protein